MFDIHLFKLEVKIGENFWWTVAGTTGSLVCSYFAYRYISSKRYVKDTSQKCVFITGCDTGFGQQLAKHLDTLGVPVFAGCLTNDGKQRLQSESSSLLKTLQVDVTSSSDIASAAEFVRSNLPDESELWGVVNNAGITGAGGPVEFQKRLDFEEVMQVNFLGTVEINNAFLPLLKKSHGRIVNVCSIEALSPTPFSTAYVASKYAVLGYSVALRREKAMWGISVSTIMPSFYKTEMINVDKMRSMKMKQWQDLPEEVKEEYGEDFAEKYIEMYEKISTRRSNVDLTPVINSIEHALFSVSPHKNYMVGRGTWMMSWLEHIPSMMDWISQRDMNIYPKALQTK